MLIIVITYSSKCKKSKKRSAGRSTTYNRISNSRAIASVSVDQQQDLIIHIVLPEGTLGLHLIFAHSACSARDWKFQSFHSRLFSRSHSTRFSPWVQTFYMHNKDTKTSEALLCPIPSPQDRTESARQSHLVWLAWLFSRDLSSSGQSKHGH